MSVRAGRSPPGFFRRWLGQLVTVGNRAKVLGSAAGSLGRPVCAHLVDSAIRRDQLGDPRVITAIECGESFAVLQRRRANQGLAKLQGMAPVWRLLRKISKDVRVENHPTSRRRGCQGVASSARYQSARDRAAPSTPRRHRHAARRLNPPWELRPSGHRSPPGSALTRFGGCVWQPDQACASALSKE